MALSGLHNEVGSLSREEEEANLRTMRTINSFEDVYKTYKHETQCFLPPTIPTYKNKSNTSIKTLKNHVDHAYRPSTSTLIGQKVRDKIRELRHQHPEIKGRESLPNNPQNHIDVNCSRFRITSGQIINKGNGSSNYIDFNQSEYPQYGVDSCNCQSLPQPTSSYPANYMGYYDQCPGQTYFEYCKDETPLNPSNQTKSNHRERIDYCCCSYGSNDSMRDIEHDKALREATVPKTRSHMDSKDSESTSSEACCCCDRIQQNPSRSENICYQDRGLIMPDDINKSDCGTHSLFQDRGQCCVGGCLPTKQSNWNDECSCSPIPSPTTSECLPPFFLMDLVRLQTIAVHPPPLLEIAVVRLQAWTAAAVLTIPSPPCLGMGSGTAAGMASMNLNNNNAANNACYCSGYINDVLQSQTVYSMDYQPIGCRGNNFNHFPNTRNGTGSGNRSGCIRMGGAGMPIIESCRSNSYYQQPGCPTAGANFGLCGDLCGGQSNGIYAIGDLCSGMDFQQCYPLSQLR
ncbi:uncharacterized protein [Drosophila tropicalis]|uniref:uncharacterized protein n=1 Tax=Drosophila tropicalis TaxID=46794 RepID=UPI0035AB77E2